MTAQEMFDTLILKTNYLDDACANLDVCVKNGKCRFKVEGCDECEDYKIAKGLQKLVDCATPKLVEYEDIGYDYFGGGDNVYACICPNCGLHIIEFDDSMISNCDSDEPKQMFHSCMTHHGYKGLNQFCNRCGQALDWSKEDENTL